MILDLSGYSFSGKSAFYDLLSNVDGAFSHSKEFEFDFIRVQGGIIDLHSALCDNWSPIRSSEAIRRFSRLIRYLGGDRKFTSRIYRYGPHYDFYFKNFTLKAEQFLGRLIKASWVADWPFTAYDESYSISIIDKYLSKIGVGNQKKIFLARVSSEYFESECKHFFNELFSLHSCSNAKFMILNNAFEPFFPERSMRFINDSKAIVVDRDPRDIYISALKAGKINGTKVGLAVVGPDVRTFIDRFLAYREFSSNKVLPNVYRTTFEKLILDYDQELFNLCKFFKPLEINFSPKLIDFDPEKSKSNIMQWRDSSNNNLAPDIKIIEKHLQRFCTL